MEAGNKRSFSKITASFQSGVEKRGRFSCCVSAT